MYSKECKQKIFKKKVKFMNKCCMKIEIRRKCKVKKKDIVKVTGKHSIKEICKNEEKT